MKIKSFNDFSCFLITNIIHSASHTMWIEIIYTAFIDDDNNEEGRSKKEREMKDLWRNLCVRLYS